MQREQSGSCSFGMVTGGGGGIFGAGVSVFFLFCWLLLLMIMQHIVYV